MAEAGGRKAEQSSRSLHRMHFKKFPEGVVGGEFFGGVAKEGDARIAAGPGMAASFDRVEDDFGGFPAASIS